MSIEESQLGDICDEGGSHEWTRPISGFDWFLCFTCCPCYALLSCMMSEGAAFANPVMEQMLGKSERVKQGQEPPCRKCGLTKTEAQNLNSVRRAEMRQSGTGSAPGYFSSQMKVPDGVAWTFRHFKPAFLPRSFSLHLIFVPSSSYQWTSFCLALLFPRQVYRTYIQKHPFTHYQSLPTLDLFCVTVTRRSFSSISLSWVFVSDSQLQIKIYIE